MSAAEENDHFLLCRIGTRIGALALKDVRETMRPLPVEPLQGTPSFVLGLAVVRGVPVPVVDAGELLGRSTRAATISPSSARFVSLKSGLRTIVLAVDAVLDVRSLMIDALADVPPLLQEVGADLVSAIGALDTQLLLVLKAARMVPESVWSAMRAFEGSL